MTFLKALTIVLALTSNLTLNMNSRLATPTTSTSVAQSYKGKSNGSWLGRLTIGSYSANLYQSDAQSVVDADDSAALNDWGGQYFIADHAHQGFSVLRSLGAGATATIVDDNTITYLTMASTYQGYNSGQGIDLVDGRYAEDVYDGNYIMYTCNDSEGYNVTVTYWNETGSEPLNVEPVVEETTTNEVVDSTPVETTTNEVVEVADTKEEVASVEEESKEVSNHVVNNLYNMVNWDKKSVETTTTISNETKTDFFMVDFKKLLVVKFFNY